MKTILTLATTFLLAPILMSAQEASPKPPENTAQQDARMEWWREAKFGMFIHWGLYAIPARGEWVMNREKIPVAEYAKLATQFNPVKFNADRMGALCQGCRDEIHRHHLQAPRRFCDVWIEGQSLQHRGRHAVQTRPDEGTGRGLREGRHQARILLLRKPRTGTSRVARWPEARGTRRRKATLTTTCTRLPFPRSRNCLSGYNPAVIWFDTPVNMTPASAREICPGRSQHPPRDDCQQPAVYIQGHKSRGWTRRSWTNCGISASTT